MKTNFKSLYPHSSCMNCKHEYDLTAFDEPSPTCCNEDKSLPKILPWTFINGQPKFNKDVSKEDIKLFLDWFAVHQVGNFGICDDYEYDERKIIIVEDWIDEDDCY